MKLLVFWYYDTFCDCQMLRLAGVVQDANLTLA